MTNGREFDQPTLYRIRVKGHLNPAWAQWFNDFSITQEKDDVCLLTGCVIDQAALYGLIAKMGSFGLPLLSVTQVESKGSSSNELPEKER